MQIHLNANLKPFHTFSIDVQCRVLVIVESIEDIVSVFQRSEWQNFPKLMLGRGSNVLFTSFYDGVVLVNQYMGRHIMASDDAFHLHIHGGEDWPKLVQWTVENHIGGLENLAMIPGCCGSAPIQNIGAYGVEFSNVCEYVDYLCLETFQVKRLTQRACEFHYRDSIFKHALLGKAIVLHIGLKLPKCWQAVRSYGPLQALPSTCTVKDVFRRVCEIRSHKLPDPMQIGNAGSFFKNPVILLEKFQTLQAKFPDMPYYETDEGIKIAAGWLIDQCQLKGYQVGGAQVHQQQALVLINHADASAADVIRLAYYIYTKVKERFDIELSHEVRFLGATAEIHLMQAIKAL